MIQLADNKPSATTNKNRGVPRGLAICVDASQLSTSKLASNTAYAHVIRHLDGLEVLHELRHRPGRLVLLRALHGALEHL